jgi:hypothetical protein
VIIEEVPMGMLLVILTGIVVLPVLALLAPGRVEARTHAGGARVGRR